MKRFFYILSLLASLPVVGLAQTTTENFVKTETMLNSASNSSSLKAIQYYNGLGYPTVGATTVGQSGQTAYTLTTYDALNREERQYLPVATDNSIAYKAPSTIISNSTTFYSNDNTAYTQNHYDALDRVLFKEQSGQAWRSANKRDTLIYAANTADDKVLRYTASSANNTLTATGQYYPDGSLTKETTKDPDGKTVVTFKDLFGNVVLQRVAGNLDTYYVYDDLGRLRFVLPPAYQDKKNKALYCYEYRYDNKGRVVRKYLPGAEYVEYWHDTADRVICMQDGAMRKAGKYRFTIYDKFGHVAIQGVCTNYLYKPNHNVNPSVTATYTPNCTGFLNTGYTVDNTTNLFPGATLEVVNYYDNYDFVSKNHNSRFSGISVPTAVKQTGRLTGSTVIASNGEWLSQVMVYDVRGNLLKTVSRELNGRIVTSTNTYSFTNKLVTSNRTVNVGYGDDLTFMESNGYNGSNDKRVAYTVGVAHGKPLASLTQSYAYNALGQLSTVTRPFTGNATKTVNYTYDLHGWLKSITAKGFSEELFYADGPGEPLFNGNISAMKWTNGNSIISSTMEWANGNGNITTMEWANGNNAHVHDNMIAYDGTNRITDVINVKPDTLSSIINKPIDEIPEYPIIANSTDRLVRGYKFTYDDANRLTDAVYGEKDSLDTNTDRYSEKGITYDKNGNIKKLERRGKKQNGSYGIIDNLNITYNGNQLSSVTESAAELTYNGSLDYKGSKGSQYKYNENGSLVSDKSRGIAFISYDLSGNPLQIYFTNGNVTKYVYTASGQKLRTVYYTAVPNITRTIGTQPAELTQAQILSVDSTDYLLGGSLVLKNGRIDKVIFDGGYCQATAENATTDKFAFNFYNKDHLGNIREVVNAAGKVKQVTNYYPFGATYFDNSAATSPDYQPYKYNGKEFDKMNGLNTYDYGARQHEPTLARWDRIDPLCEKYYSISPYAYCGNNPVNRIDPDGQKFTDSLQQYVDEYLDEIATKRWTLMKQMQLYGNSQDLTELYFECIRAEIELAVLAESDQVYDLKTGLNKEVNGMVLLGETSYDPQTKNVLIDLKDVPSSGNFASLAHELKHCYQFDTGYLSFRKNRSGEFIGGLLYDYGDEVEAFKRGALFGGNPQIPTEYNYLKDDEHIRYHRPGTCLELGTAEQNFLRQQGEIYRLSTPRTPLPKAYPLIMAGARWHVGMFQ